jgi:hypothetical protein
MTASTHTLWESIDDWIYTICAHGSYTDMVETLHLVWERRRAANPDATTHLKIVPVDARPVPDRYRQAPEGMRFSMAGFGARDVTLSGYDIVVYGEEGPYHVTTGYEVCVVYQGQTYYRSYAEASEAFDAAVRTLRAAKKVVR